MKRSFEDEQQLQSLAVAKCLMFLSQKLNKSSSDAAAPADTTAATANNKLPVRVFECKACDRRFPSFQALGGHRASHHKRPKFMTANDNTSHNQDETTPLPTKPKTHECSICGSEFPTGQALGGHMRRHRMMVVKDSEFSVPKLPPVLMRSNSSKRVMCMDLNLTPLENDLELMFGKRAPKVCLI